MIDPKKTYRTRYGREVRIYAVDGANGDPVHGAVLTPDGWEGFQWHEDGRWMDRRESGNDLIEVRPRIQREVWVNVYKRYTRSYPGKAEADSDGFDRIACVKVVIDCEEGEGL